MRDLRPLTFARDVARYRLRRATAADTATLVALYDEASAWLTARGCGPAAGLGAALLDWAGARVAATGRGWLRLDCVATNDALRAYYERQGFALRGVANHGWSALYERPAAGDVATRAYSAEH